MNLEKVAEILDAAVAKVAVLEFERTLSDTSDIEAAARINAAAASLDKLRNGGTPDYSDPLVGVLYLAQYQLQHINLTYSLINSTTSWYAKNGSLSDKGRLHVVDFGCGALAMRFGVVLAVAEALENGLPISALKIDSLDPVVPVVEIGIRIWDEFWNSIHARSDGDLSTLRQAFAILDRQYPAIQHPVRLQQIEPMPNANTWLSAIHVVYSGPQGNSEAIKDDLSTLSGILKPDLGFITTHDSKLQMMQDVSPFDASYVGRADPPSPKFNNNMASGRCEEILHKFRHAGWETFWIWAPGTVFWAFGKKQE